MEWTLGGGGCDIRVKASRYSVWGRAWCVRKAEEGGGGVEHGV